MKVWSFIHSSLQNKLAAALLYVVDSQGSSPGRKGFIMAVNEQGIFEGTIGGGIMEVKMIELAKSQLKKGRSTGIIKQQFHNKQHARNQSGLICSGSQTVVCISLTPKNIEVIEAITHINKSIFVHLNHQSGLQISTEGKERTNIRTENDFDCVVKINPPKTVHIFGAGHVGLALAKQMSILNYRIIQYDDRPDLVTLAKNQYAHELKIIDYKNLKKEMITSAADVVVIVSFSYRSDKIILQQLYNQPFAYIGMMGSDHKIATLKKEIAEEGIPATAISHVFMPIGLNMYSKTAAEIAVSIAGQIILAVNRKMPTGRNYLV